MRMWSVCWDAGTEFVDVRICLSHVSTWRPGFDLGPLCVGYVLRKVAVGGVFLRTPRLSHVSIISSSPSINESLKKQETWR
jgi:hypothetical protein